jgi:hypothetical protein
MKRSNESHPPAVVVRPHPPERLIRAMARGEVAACCTCSSCCCCLHSLGGLVGAVAGTYLPAESPAPHGKQAPPAGLRDDDLDGPVAAARTRPGSTLVVPKIFWWSTVVLAVLIIVLAPLISVESAPAIGVGLVIIGLPFVLLGGSVVSAIVLAGHPTLRAVRSEWARLGWITLGILGGTLAGVLLMVLFFRR